ncbi:hypothetical protein [Lysinibacillus sp. NPDC056185]|uniref:hypothetical protein n=1 Tax=Lysinibacillus sp. NPDC056185 TaxID=3345739 RepID=UPI0039EEC603
MEITHFRQLDYFIKKGAIPRIELTDKQSIDFSLGFFLGIENGFPLHEASKLSAQSLKQSWEENNNYIEKVIEYLEEFWNWEIEYSKNYINLHLDNEIIRAIKSVTFQPPTTCCPIYIITVGEGESEKVVYIGKTSSANNRFRGGHTVALKLHHPKYDGLKKSIYFASVMLLSKDEEYLPLEFISNLKGAEKLLLEVEASLIYQYKPELNTISKKKANYDIVSEVHIQNFSHYSKFLNDNFIYV